MLSFSLAIVLLVLHSLPVLFPASGRNVVPLLQFTANDSLLYTIFNVRCVCIVTALALSCAYNLYTLNSIIVTEQFSVFTSVPSLCHTM